MADAFVPDTISKVRTDCCIPADQEKDETSGESGASFSPDLRCWLSWHSRHCFWTPFTYSASIAFLIVLSLGLCAQGTTTSILIPPGHRGRQFETPYYNIFISLFLRFKSWKIVSETSGDGLSALPLFFWKMDFSKNVRNVRGSFFSLSPRRPRCSNARCSQTPQNELRMKIYRRKTGNFFVFFIFPLDIFLFFWV